MKAYRVAAVAFVGVFTCVSITAQSASTPKPVRKSIYLQDAPLNFAALVPPPPAAGSAADNADRAAVRQAQQARTVATIAAAKRDDAEEDIFIYATVLGARFDEKSLPLTAAFSLHIRGEAGTVTPALKQRWGRPRPFIADAAIHAVCEQKAEPSYPSGHAMVGYLEGFTLAQMLPERSAEILARAREYAENRVVCGVHYPSDTEASRTAALAEFGALSTSPRFQSELAAARAEVRKAFELPVDLPH